MCNEGDLSYGAHGCCLIMLLCLCLGCRSPWAVFSKGEVEAATRGKACACFELVVGGTRTPRVGEPVVMRVYCKCVCESVNVCVRVCSHKSYA